MVKNELKISKQAIEQIKFAKGPFRQKINVIMTFIKKMFIFETGFLNY